MSFDRRALRQALLETAPWLAATDHGPQAVAAGSCDRCGDRPRLLPTCGPTAYEALCRDCAEAEGDDAWCAGHLDEGRAARSWAAQLPEHWPDVVVAWWVATGEVRLDHDHGAAPELHPEILPSVVRELLPPD